MNNLIILTKLVIEEYKNSKALSEQNVLMDTLNWIFVAWKKD